MAYAQLAVNNWADVTVKFLHHVKNSTERGDAQRPHSGSTSSPTGSQPPPSTRHSSPYPPSRRFRRRRPSRMPQPCCTHTHVSHSSIRYAVPSRPSRERISPLSVSSSRPTHTTTMKSSRISKPTNTPHGSSFSHKHPFLRMPRFSRGSSPPKKISAPAFTGQGAKKIHEKNS